MGRYVLRVLVRGLRKGPGFSRNNHKFFEEKLPCQ
jgi:hypothetical protein